MEVTGAFASNGLRRPSIRTAAALRPFVVTFWPWEHPGAGRPAGYANEGPHGFLAGFLAPGPCPP
jgi:hypothetical protein